MNLRLFSSLKLAVFVLLTLSLSLAVATFIESNYDTATAQYFVYRAPWFMAILGLLGVNIFCVAMSRYPWKRAHTPFLLAHLGILILLTGSWITYQYGLDGSIRITEGEVLSTVEVAQPILSFYRGGKLYAYPVKWQPPGVAFKPIFFSEFGVWIDQFISHADAEMKFSKVTDASALGFSALKLKIEGGPMRIVQEFWLWGGDPTQAQIQMGPAQFSISNLGEKLKVLPARGPAIAFAVSEKGQVSYRAVSSDGKQVSGLAVAGTVVRPGWRGDVHLTVLEVYAKSLASNLYHPSQIQYGEGAPPSAIHLKTDSSDVWMGLGDRTLLQTGAGDREGEIGLGYFPQTFVLPFSVRLNRFEIERYEGSTDPASYRSQVSVIEGGAANPKELKSVTISMNEPLYHQGMALYQASYEDARPRPVTSIFSVNRDPGRKLKYLGSILIVLGSILLFAAKYRKRKKVEPRV